MTGPVDRQLSGFTAAGYDKGRSKIWQALWFATMNMIFSKWWCPSKLRPIILRLFGAKIGRNVLIRHRVRVHWPWKLEVGSNCWIGEDAWLINLEPIVIGDDVCISQRVVVCTGSHDFRSSTLEYDNGPIAVEDGSWLAIDSMILRGVTIGRGSTIGARAVVRTTVEPGTLVRPLTVF